MSDFEIYQKFIEYQLAKVESHGLEVSVSEDLDA